MCNVANERSGQNKMHIENWAAEQWNNGLVFLVLTRLVINNKFYLAVFNMNEYRVRFDWNWATCSFISRPVGNQREAFLC